MRLAIMQPYFLPYVGYFHLLDAVDEFVFFDDVNFIKRGWVNRNNFLVQGRAHLFSVSLIGASQNDLIKDVRINYTEKWKDNFIKILQFNYSKAKNYEAIFSFMNKYLSQDYEYISDLNIAIIEGICAYLEMEKTFKKSSSIAYDRAASAEGKILSICSVQKATQYINPIGGLELYDKAQFTEKNIVLNFVQSEALSYEQHKGKEFVPHLSFLDMLMFCDVSQVKEHLKKYSLK